MFRWIRNRFDRLRPARLERVELGADVQEFPHLVGTDGDPPAREPSRAERRHVVRRHNYKELP